MKAQEEVRDCVFPAVQDFHIDLSALLTILDKNFMHL